MTPKTGVDGEHPVQRCTRQDGGLAADLCVGVCGVLRSRARHDTNILFWRCTKHNGGLVADLCVDL